MKTCRTLLIAKKMDINKSRPKIAYLTSNDPQDRRSWSGTHYYIAQALQRHCGDVTYIGPISPPAVLFKKAFAKALWEVAHRRYLYTHTIALSKQIARIAEQKMTGKHFDLIVAPAGSAEIAHLDTTVPIVYLSDTTLALMVDYNDEFSALLSSSFEQANCIERLATRKAALALYSSNWAAQSAVEDYHADKRKIFVVPFGANIDEVPLRDSVLDRPAPERCRLLFIGTDWQRKGGDIAYETLVALEARGIPSDLTIVGCVPPKSASHRNMKVIGFVNKNEVKGRQLLSELLRKATFLIHPTRTECYGIVCCEANAFGLPVIASDTGGISEIVKNGENGYLLPPSARGSEYADIISEVFTCEENYIERRKCSRLSFETRLNWDAWGCTVHELISPLVMMTKGASSD